MQRLIPLNKVKNQETKDLQSGRVSDKVIEEIFGVKPTPLSEEEKAIHDSVGPGVLVYKVASRKVEVILRKTNKYKLTKLNKEGSE
jgi:hypothetical protein